MSNCDCDDCEARKVPRREPERVTLPDLPPGWQWLSPRAGEGPAMAEGPGTRIYMDGWPDVAEVAKEAWRLHRADMEDDGIEITELGRASASFARTLRTVMGELEEMLLAKNAAYGNSALEPVRIFSKADAREQLRVRIDDKLSRLMKGHDVGEDTARDLLGYLVLLEVAKRLGGGE